MSIIRIAVDSHEKHTGLSTRDILRAAYMKKYGREMPPNALEEDVAKWESGDSNIPYLLDFMLGVHCATN